MAFSAWPRQPKEPEDPRQNLGLRWSLSQPRPAPGGPSSPLATRGFAAKGVRRFYSPTNTNGNQFNTKATQQAAQHALRTHTLHQYFRRAGFGAALRYTLGMEQVPSHLQDYLNARTHGRNQGGQHVGPIYAHYGRNTEAYQPSHRTYYSDIDSE